MEDTSLLFGKNIDWKHLQMWRVIHLTSLARVKDGKALPPGPGQPYGLLTIETPKLSGTTEAIVAIAHSVDFLNAWSLFNKRGVGEDEEVLVSYAPPQKFLLRLFAFSLPRLAFQVFSAGNLERRLALSGDTLSAIEANNEEPRYIIYPETSL